ncbi:MAG TPA: thermonuclease family protein [Hyphomicrobium sp.]|nr:thermonuclease family protein [Hyphomicrobium sp.]
MTTSAPTSFKLGRASFIAGAFFCITCQWDEQARAELHGAAEALASFAGPATVVDGDTLDIAGQRVRLEGIDAPETAQICKSADGRDWSCGRAASKFLRTLIAGNDVVCDRQGTDKYGRTLAICFADGRDLNAAMVRAGMAWAFVRYSSMYVVQETEARQALAGVWRGPSEAPWDFRQKGWKAAEVSAPKGCAIKGNVSSKGHIYHMPWSPWYDRVTIEPSRGEHWFCSENEAKAAGWRPAPAF